MKSLFTKQLVPAALIIAFLTSGFIGLSIPKPVYAGGDACKGGMVVAVAQLAWATIKGTVSAQTGTEGSTQRFLGNYKDASSFINDCILKPLAQMMVVALIRNIGASIVNWVNTGFEGKPSFVTDFEGTVLNAADQAVGNFIEGDADLGFLCSPFSFQIRLALALKYSQPFQEQVRCTLTDIGNNINNFANNNGGAGWDNWLKVTAEPQNNVYGAYLIADSELARRMANAVDVKEKRISLGQGFLDFETCDEPESDAAYAKRLDLMHGTNKSGQNPNLAVGATAMKVTTSVFDSNNIGSSPTVTTEFVDASSEKRGCKSKSVKTPGRVIADQLQNEFATGPIQRAVAQEIDQVISATLNQLAQKAIQGASGLLGLSQRKQSSSVSYIDRYRAQFYGQSTTATVGDTGAQSELDAYTVGSYNDALALRNDPTNSDIQGIDTFTDQAAGSQIDAQQNQLNSTVTAYAGQVTERNIALSKPSSQSSSLNAAQNGNDGVRQTSQYVKGAETSSGEAGGWWEVDLGADTSIDKINIYPNESPSAPDGGLGTFDITVRSDSGNSSTIAGSSFTNNSGVLTTAVGKTGRYVRVTRQASETTCNEDYFGDTYASGPCANQPHLAFAELEVMQKVDNPSAATSTPSTTGGGATAPVADNATPTSTLAWDPLVASGARVSDSSGMSQEIKLSAGKSVSGLVVTLALYDSSNRNIPFSNVFGDFDILRGPTGTWVSSKQYIDSTTGSLRVGLSINQNSSFSFKFLGTKRGGALPGNYTFISRVEDSTHTVLEDKTQRTNFVVE